MSTNLFDIADNVVLVSGGSRGIGLALAEAFAQQDAKVVITGRNEDTLAQACRDAASSRHSITYQICDVSDEADIAACVGNVVETHGQIDTLINCAGINVRKPVVDFSAEEFDDIVRINLRGAFLVSKAVGKQMIRQGSGNQINIDSLSSHGPLPQIVPYAMTKTGLSSMTKGLALEWGKHGIRVNGIAPGFIMTDLTRKLWSNENMQNWHKTVAPLQRLGEVEDLVATAVFLASPGAAFLTGQIIRVDGGITAGITWPISDDFQVTPAD